MKPIETTSIVNSNIKSDFEFSMKASKHAFKILSDSLYSDKILAVVREYLANALDAHIAAKQTIPFIITEPSLNILDGMTHWEVRDFGLGLSKEDIQKYYCTYFSSSKQESNDYTGMLGLGCKSAFAYTKQFTVTSWFNGTKTEYLLFIDDGLPQATELYSEPSDEPSGIKVSIPVQYNDVNRFKEVTLDLTEWFPNEYLQERYKFNQPVAYEDDYLLVTQGNYDSSVKAQLLMGNVLYTIRSDMPKEIRETYRSFINLLQRYRYNVIFKIPTGSISILPSREGISYDKPTINYLIKFVKKCEYILEKRWQEISKGKKAFDNLDEFIDGLYLEKASLKRPKHKTLKFKQEVKYYSYVQKPKKVDIYDPVLSYIHANSFSKTRRIVAVIDAKKIKGISTLVAHCATHENTLNLFTCKNKLDKRLLKKYLRKYWSGKIYEDISEILTSLGVVTTAKSYTSRKAKTFDVYKYTASDGYKISTKLCLTRREIKELMDTAYVLYNSSLPSIVTCFPELVPEQKDIYLLPSHVYNKSVFRLDVNTTLDFDFSNTVSKNNPKELLVTRIAKTLDSMYGTQFDNVYLTACTRYVFLLPYKYRNLYIDTIVYMSHKESKYIMDQFIEYLLVEANKEYFLDLVRNNQIMFTGSIYKALGLSESEFINYMEKFACQYLATH